MITPPYNDIFGSLLIAIHKALWHCHVQHEAGNILDEADKELSQIFEGALKLPSYRVTGLDAQIIKGLTLSEAKRKQQNLYPRLSKLVIQAYLKTQEFKGQVQTPIIPSPLNILYHALTVPQEPQTSAYSYVLCRGMLFYFLRLHPKHPDLERTKFHYDEFGEEDITKAINSFKNNVDIYQRWPDLRRNTESFSSRINHLSGHILSLKGYTYLWFQDETHLEAFCKVGQSKQADLATLYCNRLRVTVRKEAKGNKLLEDYKYSFRISGVYSDLPDISEINNWMFGIPIPWRGADLLFFGGLKKTASTGLVMSIHGQPGTGKTSAALSLAAVMSPFGTKTFYISLEEKEEDLITRLNSLVPTYLRNLSIYPNNNHKLKSKKASEISLDWFTPMKLNEDMTIEFLSDILDELVTRMGEEEDEGFQGAKKENQEGPLIPIICPLILVIDNVNELFERKISYDDLEKFVEKCRDLGGLVILISAEDIPKKTRLDYLVDVAIRLHQEGIDQKYEKPVRVLQLLKTRHQISRQGTHVYHLSNAGGFRISPQVPSQMDKREKVRIKLPSESEFIHTLNLRTQKKKFVYENYLPIAANSQILIHGHGSSGKAGFGLKLLLTPLIAKKVLDINPELPKIELPYHKHTKVLVISFLYPEEYYKNLESRLERQFEAGFEGYKKGRSKIVVKAFYPGYLTPEDFVYKIIRLLEEARLEGEPYSGVLLDGLHNVFLQFKYLQEAHMIWPLLYSILTRYSVTVVTTFTNFALTGGDTGISEERMQSPNDFTLLQQGQKPFLHGLVKAADYFFVLEERVNPKNSKKREYLVSVRSAIRQVPPTSKFKWARENLVIYELVE